MMSLTKLSTLVGFLLVFLFWGDDVKGPSSKVFAVSSKFNKSFIDWDDLSVDKNAKGLDSNDQMNYSRVLVVDKNGRGDSLTVQGAIDLVPELNYFRHKIYILPGIYREKVHIPKSKPYISFIGVENRGSETIITWHDKASDRKEDGGEIGTFESASVTVDSDYFAPICCHLYILQVDPSYCAQFPQTWLDPVE